MDWIIDRFENDYAVIECRDACFNIPRSFLPEDVAEGDVLTISVNREETRERKTNAKERLKRLFGE